MEKNLFNLGPLEKEIMEIIWKLERASVRKVFEELKKKRKIAYTTVMTVMNRLYRKNLIDRQRKEKAYLYFPRQKKEKFLAQQTKKTLYSLFKECKEIAISQFLDFLEKTEPEKIKKWRKKLKKS